MKFPRNARMLRSHLDAAPFACVLFCTLIFVLLCSLVYTPGVLIQLPASKAPVSGASPPIMRIALYRDGTYYFENQIISEAELVKRLKAEAARHSEPLTLVVAADALTTTEQMVHLEELAKSANVHNLWQQVLPQMFETQPKRGPKP